MDTDLDIPYSVPQVKFVQTVVRPIGMFPNKKRPKQKKRFAKHDLMHLR
jgi:hypothetical protein